MPKITDVYSTFPNTLHGPVTVDEFDWEGNNMEMRYISCPRHPGVKYLTKHPWQRTVHIIEWDDANPCKCGYGTMIVLPD